MKPSILIASCVVIILSFHLSSSSTVKRFIDKDFKGPTVSTDDLFGSWDDTESWEDVDAEIEDEDEGDTEVRGLFSKAKKHIDRTSVKRRCDCLAENVCGCCVLLHYTKVKEGEPNKTSINKVCMNATDIPNEEGMQISLVINSQEPIKRHIAKKEICANIPFTAEIVSACIKPYNTTVNAEGIHSCIKARLKLFGKKILNLDFNCLRLSKGKMAMYKGGDKDDFGIFNFNVTSKKPQFSFKNPLKVLFPKDKKKS